MNFVQSKYCLNWRITARCTNINSGNLLVKYSVSQVYKFSSVELLNVFGVKKIVTPLILENLEIQLIGHVKKF